MQHHPNLFFGCYYSPKWSVSILKQNRSCMVPSRTERRNLLHFCRVPTHLFQDNSLQARETSWKPTKLARETSWKPTKFWSTIASASRYPFFSNFGYLGAPSNRVLSIPLLRLRLRAKPPLLTQKPLGPLMFSIEIESRMRRRKGCQRWNRL